MESILDSIKKGLSIPEESQDFDPELIMFINSAFSTLNQLGVGPDEGYEITGRDEVWMDYNTDRRVGDLKSYIYLKVRMLFDPPSIAVLTNSFQSQIDELEWRLNVKREEDRWTDGLPMRAQTSPRTSMT